MFFVDAQTSGGILMSVKKEDSALILEDLRAAGYPASSIVGEIGEKEDAFTLKIEK